MSSVAYAHKLERVAVEESMAASLLEQILELVFPAQYDPNHPKDDKQQQEPITNKSASIL